MTKDTDRIYDYDYREVHADLENQQYAGTFGWDNAAYWAIAEKKANVNLNEHYKKRTPDEYYLPELKELLDNPETQKWWKRIVTFDPFGMTATNPTIAGTTSILNIPELSDLERDGTIVDEDGGVHCMKAGIYHAWNIPALSKRLELSEQDMRETLYKFTKNPELKDPKYRVFLPHIGGQTVYMFGDPRKIRNDKTEIAVRVHDECNGSDVFGTDICTCRPYLMFAARQAVECAQRGGVGILVYFRKEGRSLGEIVKYRVYNARKNQKGGDRAAKYFHQTESIAGIRDARFQTMMPDVLNWLGIARIDWLFSMSAEKYDAITESGIQVNQRVELPDSWVPKHAFVEMTAKIMSGYHTEEIKSQEVLVEMRTLEMIRKQCGRVYELAKQQKLQYWDFHPDKIDACVDEVDKMIKKTYPDLNIPPHSRFRHIDGERLNEIMKGWTDCRVSKEERTRRLLDMITVSVLTDAGAGHEWSYVNWKGDKLTRSEGIAGAIFEMFMDGVFSSDAALKTRVNSLGLINLQTKQLQIGFQLTKTNVMVGLEGRVNLLQRLGTSMSKHPEYFGYEIHRPGNLLDYLLDNAKDGKVSVNVLWKALMLGMEDIWPERRSGVKRGDVWTHNLLKVVGKPGSDLVPFHKLTQWLCLSIMEAVENYGLEFTDTHLLTPLAEYRNGGLLVDTDVLTLKDHVSVDRYYDVGSELVVEWRALTICLVDEITERLRKRYNKKPDELTTAKVLEGGTWRTGRALAYAKRPQGQPPLKLRSEGNVF